LIAQPKIVSFGGGHGLAATLSALRTITKNLTAIVTVADNGGSSGRLRAEFNSLPPGDLRMALAALCGDDDWGRSWADLMQYRFTSNGELNGHALGNLLLAALWDRDADPIAGLERVGQLLKVVGRVLPMSREPLEIEGAFQTRKGTLVIRGQKEVALAKGSLKDLKLIPGDAKPTDEGINAIAEADFLTIGPGSWFSSVMPHLMLAPQRKAICESKARRILILNLPANEMQPPEELGGIGAADHLAVIRKFAPNFKCDFAIADVSIQGDELDELQGATEEMGGKLISRQLALSDGIDQHDPKKLALCFREIMSAEVIR
jgi:uncharacterized cofD-like protein